MSKLKHHIFALVLLPVAWSLADSYIALNTSFDYVNNPSHFYDDGEYQEKPSSTLASDFQAGNDDASIVLPYFVDVASSSNVTVNPGEKAVLICVVRNLDSHLVIWRRANQLMPLTIGETRHVLDQRISPLTNERTGEWSLVINDAKLSDSGAYVCQVNAVMTDGSYLERRINLRVRDVPLLVIDAHEPDAVVMNKLSKITSLSDPVLFNLLTTLRSEPNHLKTVAPPVPALVLADKIKNHRNSFQPPKMLNRKRGSQQHHRLNDKHRNLAIGGTDYIDRGHNLELWCNATAVSPNAEKAPSNVEWFKDGERLVSSRGSGFFITKHAVGKTMYSTLLVYKAEPKHSGDYVCRVPEINAVESYKVTILNVQPFNVKRGAATRIGRNSRVNTGSQSTSSTPALLALLFFTFSRRP